MDQERAAFAEPGRADGPGVIDPEAPLLTPDFTTPVLRRCTALATRARVELLSAGRHSAADELAEVLTQIAAWEPGRLIDPDPTMLALSIASLQDLSERLPGPDGLAGSAALPGVLSLLHDRLHGTALGTPA